MSSALRRRVDGGLLGRLLEDPGRAPALRALPAPALRRVILRVGLEDAGELVALATLEQLREVFDEDLWRSEAPGRDEAFDAARFVLWLEVMLEGGEALVADRLAELSEDFLAFALSQVARVVDVALLPGWAGEEGGAEALEAVMDAHAWQELDAFLLFWRCDAGWDAVWTALLALDARHPLLLREVLARCAAATHAELHGADALHTALEGEDLLLEDACAEREARRAERGYVSPADARAFLALARTAPETPGIDPITRAHFRELGPATEPASPAAASDGPAPGSSLRRLLLEAGAGSDAPAAAPAEEALFRRTLVEMLETDPDAHQRVVEELAFLANVLIAGDTQAARPWRPAEAAERVLELCDEGLRRLVEDDVSAATARETLVRWGAVGLFRVAWAARAEAG